MGESFLEKSRRQAIEARRMAASRRTDNAASELPTAEEIQDQSDVVETSDTAVVVCDRGHPTGKGVDRTSASNFLLSKDAAIEAVRNLYKGVSCGFVLRKYVDVMERKGLKLTSSFYDMYFLLCYENTLMHASWAVCPYYADGSCVIEKAVRKFQPSQGGTGSFRDHLQGHTGKKRKNEDQTLISPRKLGAEAKKAVAMAAATAVYMDFRPMSFAEPSKGLADFAAAIFLEGQKLSASAVPDMDDLLPSASFVKSCLVELAARGRAHDTKIAIPRAKKYGGGMSSDGLKKKRTGIKYYDLTLHYFEVETFSEIGKDRLIALRTRMLFLAEHRGELGETAAAIRSTLESKLVADFGLTLSELQDRFTLVTDWAATMPRIVGASVSETMAPLNLAWSGCSAHQLCTVLRKLFDERDRHECPDLDAIHSDVEKMKAIIRIFKSCEYNHLLPDGMALFQESETRFHHLHDVTARFEKSLTQVMMVVEKQGNAGAQKLLGEMNIKNFGADTRCPNLSGVVRVCRPFVNAIVKLQTTQSPSLYFVLPMYAWILTELKRMTKLETTSSFGNEEETAVIVLANKALKAIKEKLVIHPLHAAAIILHPHLKSMESLTPFGEREVERCKRLGHELIKVAMHQTAAASIEMEAPLHNPKPASNVRSSSDFRISNFYDRTDQNCGGRERSCDDELQSYLSMPISKTDADLMGSDDDFSVPRFWVRHERTFPALSEAALRILAIPASQCASERNFSAAENVQSSKCSRMLPSTLNDILYLRSKGREY
jgi:hypothetical protein